jgi:hypothetical protein
MNKTFVISGKFENPQQQVPIKVSLLFDGQLLWSESVLTQKEFAIQVDDENRNQHSVALRFEGKTNTNSDTHLICRYLKINDMNLEYILENQATYYHNLNQSGTWDQTMMYGDVIGIDGELRFALETPVAFWILKKDKW